MKKIIVILLTLSLLLATPVMAMELPEIATQDVVIEFRGTKEGETPYSGNFTALNQEQFLVWLREYDEVDKDEYIDPDHTCHHFSLDLRDNFYDDYGFYGVYLAWCRIGDDGHWVNAVLIGIDAYEMESWLIIEPQNDRSWIIDEVPYDYPLKVLGFPTEECPFACMYMFSRDSQPLFFMHSVDIEEWMNGTSYPTFADWIYDRFIK